MSAQIQIQILLIRCIGFFHQHSLVGSSAGTSGFMDHMSQQIEDLLIVSFSLGLFISLMLVIILFTYFAGEEAGREVYLYILHGLDDGVSTDFPYAFFQCSHL